MWWPELSSLALLWAETNVIHKSGAQLAWGHQQVFLTATVGATRRWGGLVQLIKQVT